MKKFLVSVTNVYFLGIPAWKTSYVCVYIHIHVLLSKDS